METALGCDSILHHWDTICQSIPAKYERYSVELLKAVVDLWQTFAAALLQEILRWTLKQSLRKEQGRHWYPSEHSQHSHTQHTTIYTSTLHTIVYCEMMRLCFLRARLRRGCAWCGEWVPAASTFIVLMSLYTACCWRSVIAFKGTWWAVGLALLPPLCRWRAKYRSSGSCENTSVSIPHQGASVVVEQVGQRSSLQIWITS